MSGSLAVSTGFGRKASQNLARVGLTLSPERRPGRRLVAMALLAGAAFAGGFGVAEVLRERVPAVVVRAPAAPNAELVQVRQQLEQAKMGLRVADSRSHELERQIDSFNQKLTESQDELTFFRKAREGRKH